MSSTVRYYKGTQANNAAHLQHAYACLKDAQEEHFGKSPAYGSTILKISASAGCHPGSSMYEAATPAHQSNPSTTQRNFSHTGSTQYMLKCLRSSSRAMQLQLQSERTMLHMHAYYAAQAQAISPKPASLGQHALHLLQAQSTLSAWPQPHTTISCVEPHLRNISHDAHHLQK